MDINSNNSKPSLEESLMKTKLKSWLNKTLKIKMTDGRVLVGTFLCTDRDANVILGTCEEYLSVEHTEPRALGLVMVPGRHIVTIHLDCWLPEDLKLNKLKFRRNQSLENAI